MLMPSSKPRPGEGSLHLVGVGPGGRDGLSLGALQALESAEELWLLDLGPARFERAFLREFLDRAPRVVNLFELNLIPGLPRELLYETYVRRVARLVTRGRRVTFLYSGNPLVWVDAVSLFKVLSARLGFPLRITPSPSFLDTVFEAVPVLGVRNLQLRMGSLEAPDVSPDVDCVVGQVGEKGSSETLIRALRRLYPRGHPVYLVARHSVTEDSAVERVDARTLARALSMKPDAQGWFVSLVIPSRRNARLIDRLSARGKRRR